MVLVKFTKDTVIIPRETAWFEYYDEHDKLVNLTESKFFKDDYLGIRYLYENKRISFIEIEGIHLEFKDSDLNKFVIPALK